MKKIFTVLLLVLFCAPVFAVCSITGGACSIDYKNNENQSSQDLYDNILNNRNESYNNQYIQNIYSPDWNSYPQSENYNSNCQFGICLPASNIQIQK